MRDAFSLARASAGNNRPARIAMIAMTINNSISVNAFGRLFLPGARKFSFPPKTRGGELHEPRLGNLLETSGLRLTKHSKCDWSKTCWPFPACMAIAHSRYQVAKVNPASRVGRDAFSSGSGLWRPENGAHRVPLKSQ